MRYSYFATPCIAVKLDQISAYSHHNHQQNLFLIILLCGNIVTILLLIIYNTQLYQYIIYK